MGGKQVSRTSEENLLIQQQLDKKARQKDLVMNLIPYAGFVFVVTALAIATGGNLFSTNNLANILNQSFVMIIVAVGASFVYAHGGMDFTVGASMGLAEFVIVTMILANRVPLAIALFVGVLVPVASSVSVACCALYLKIPVFVGSLGLRMVLMGVLNMVTTSSESGQLNISYNDYRFIDNVAVKLFVLIAIIVAGYYLFEYTGIGKKAKIIGGNRTVARESGINVSKYVIWGYVFLGVCVGIAGIFSLFRAAGVSNTSGSGTEFNLMTCIALGGFPLKGGQRSKIINAILGAMTVCILSNGLLLCNLDANIINGIKGLLFIVIVGLSYDRSSGKLVS